MQRLQRFKGQIVVTVTVTSEVKGARKAGKCEAPTLRDEHTMQRIGGGQGLRVRGAAHTEHVSHGGLGGSAERPAVQRRTIHFLL